MPNRTCRICSAGPPHREVKAREMMFGLRTVFDYFECRCCGCLQLADIPQDMSPYYPGDYYSYAAADAVPRGGWKRKLVALRNAAAVYGRPLVGRWLALRFPHRELRALAGLGLTPRSRILDVGSGSGHLLLALESAGFEDLSGIDAYLPHDRTVSARVTISRRSLAQCDRCYDLILFHHSFEHMDEPRDVLGQVRRLLAPEGRCFLRLPTSSSFAWRHFGVDWVQLDAPRHFFLHSMTSLERLVHDSGFEIERLRDDSTAFQFWGSEQYRMDIPLMSDRSFATNPRRSLFKPHQIREFEQRARALNRARDGDELIVVLRTRGSSPPGAQGARRSAHPEG